MLTCALAGAHYEFETAEEGPSSPFKHWEKEPQAENTCILFGPELLGGGHITE